MQIWIDVNSVRHWVAVCQGKDPNDASVTNELVRTLTATQVDALFPGMRFIGWRRHRGGQFVISRLAKGRSVDFRFEDDQPGNWTAWALADIQRAIPVPPPPPVFK
jgi:hypothetical protein